MGVPKKWSVIDVYGLDPELLAIVPKPVLSVILLYPVAIKVYILYYQVLNDLVNILQLTFILFCSQNEKTEEEGETVKDSKSETPDSVYHMKQYISNACGTIALVHSIANNLDV